MGDGQIDCKRGHPLSGENLYVNPSGSKVCIQCRKLWTKRYKEKNKKKAILLSKGSKVCSRCKIDKLFDEFRKANDSLTGRSSWCKDCVRDHSLQNRYGISLADHARMLEEQNYLCLICLCDLRGFVKSAAVDHCHETGKVRGLLCDMCNKGLGAFRDDVDSLERAVKYLKESRWE